MIDSLEPSVLFLFANTEIGSSNAQSQQGASSWVSVPHRQQAK